MSNGISLTDKIEKFTKIKAGKVEFSPLLHYSIYIHPDNRTKKDFSI